MLTIKELIEQLSQYSGECPFYILDHHGARYNIEIIQPAPALNPEAPIVEDTAKALCVEIAIRPSTKNYRSLAIRRVCMRAGASKYLP
jgi:hypothetical protein